MFSYFGSKSKIVHLYPKPLYPRIIEPFAGSARYALKYYKHDVWLNDVSPVICSIWEWIICASHKEIRSIPELKYGQPIPNDIPEGMRNLLGFCTIAAPGKPRKTIGKRIATEDRLRQAKARLLRWQGRLTHWRITNLHYNALPQVEATWFVDPPYQMCRVKEYTFNHTHINFWHLGKWCLNRSGQLIVCEGEGADWLPFKPLRKCSGILVARRPFQELIYYASTRKSGLGLI